MGENQSRLILEAAYRCLARDGYAGVSMRQIAAEAGVALSQVSYHFENKEGLLLAVVRDAVDRYIAKIEAEIARGSTPRAKCARLVRFLEKTLDEEPEFFCLHYDFMGLALWSESFQDQVWQLLSVFADRLEENIFSPVESTDRAGAGESGSQAMARLFLGCTFGIALQRLLGLGDGDYFRLLSVFEDVFVSSILEPADLGAGASGGGGSEGGRSDEGNHG